MREYHEETRDFGGLSQHLLRLYDEEAPDARAAGSFLCYFAPAKMVLVFCEVPVEAYKKSLLAKPVAKAQAESVKESAGEDKAGESKDSTQSKKRAADSDATAQSAPAKKKPKKSSDDSYAVGKVDHLRPVWVSAAELGKALTSTPGKGEVVQVEVQPCPTRTFPSSERLKVPFFPLNLSMLRQPQPRVWLGLSQPTEPTDSAEQKAGDGQEGGASPAGGPSTTGNPSGGGRSNKPPKSK
jgi:hypothetical protein